MEHWRLQKYVGRRMVFVMVMVLLVLMMVMMQHRVLFGDQQFERVAGVLVVVGGSRMHRRRWRTAAAFAAAVVTVALFLGEREVVCDGTSSRLAKFGGLAGGGNGRRTGGRVRTTRTLVRIDFAFFALGTGAVLVVQRANAAGRRHAGSTACKKKSK